MKKMIAIVMVIVIISQVPVFATLHVLFLREQDRG